MRYYLLIFIIIVISTSLYSQSGTWSYEGTEAFSSGAVEYTNIAFSTDDMPFIVFRDGANSNKATVMKYNGNLWEIVGSAGFSTGEVYYIDIALDSENTPIVTYSDADNLRKATSMKFDGTDWVLLGSAGFTSTQADYLSLAINSNDEPYVVYRNTGNWRASVMKFDGTNWVQVGVDGFSSGVTRSTSIAFNSSDTPYVVYKDGNFSYKAIVKTFNGTNWVNVGNSTGISAGEINYSEIAFDTGDIPYVIYRDYFNSNKSTVLKYNGTTWDVLGSAGFSSGAVEYTDIEVTSNNEVIVSFQDVGEINVYKFDGTNWSNIGESNFASGGYTALNINSIDNYFVAFMDLDNSNKATVMKFIYFPTTNIPSFPIIKDNSASFSSEIADGGASTTVTFEYGIATGDYSATTTSQTITGASSTTTVNFNVTGLDANEQYFVRARAENSVSFSYSTEASFWTLTDEPTTHTNSFAQVGEANNSISFTFQSLNTISADGYLVLRSNSNIEDPVDGTTYSVDDNIGSTVVVGKISDANATDFVLNNQQFQKSYTFKLVPFNEGDDPATINYFIDDAPTINAYTIPTLGEWGMVAFVGLMAFGGVLYVRKRIV